MRILYIALLGTGLFFGCNSEHEKVTADLTHKGTSSSLIDSVEVGVKKEKNDTLVLMKAKNFVKLMYDSAYSSVELLGNETNSSTYINNFPQSDLIAIYALGQDKMLQRQNINYTHSDIFLFQYGTDSSAAKAYDSLKSHLDKVASFAAKGSLNESDSSYLFVQGIDPKHGAFILQEQNFIISLVKRCAGNNLNNVKWITYERRFLETLGIEEGEVEVIWSSCGDGLFSIKFYNV